MKSFRQFREEKKKTLVTAFGRFNPPTIGHQKLIDMVAKVAGKNDYQIYPSQSQDAKKNPLSYNDKVKFMRKMFPKHARNIYMDKNVKIALHIADRAYKEGYTEFVYVAGSDRVNEFKVLLNKYNGKERKDGFYNFKDGIQVVSAGERDPDAEGVSGMSASKMRAAAADNDLELFATGLPKNFGEVQELLNAVRKGMGLKESFIFRKHIALPKVSDIREQYTEGKLFNIGDRVTKAGVELRVIERKPNFVVCENNEKVTFKCWLEDLKPIEEKLDPKADVETWIDDFVKSDAPQFKGKTKKERIDMALAAYYSARREGGLEEATISNNYGATLTPEKFVSLHGKDLPQTNNNLTMRAKIQSFGFNRVSREFADKVIAIVSKSQKESTGLEEAVSYPHKMYNPENGEEVEVKDEEEHNKYADKGWTHDKPEKNEEKEDDLQGPDRYYAKDAEGDEMAKSTKKSRSSHFKKQTKKATDDPSAYKPAPGDASAKTKPSSYTKKYQQLYRGKYLRESDPKKAVQNKAKETGIAFDILWDVYKRGVGAWRTGHRPGTTPEQWGLARINSFVTGGKTQKTTDADLWKKHKGA
ncbi:MAG: DUF5824 family protein [Betaproteobacteria bacterium]